MDLGYQKKLAAKILSVGESRIKFDDTQIDRISSAVTREEVRKLIEDGVIYTVYAKGNSRGRWREFHASRKEGRHRGHGKRKGVNSARMDPELVWVYRVRKLRLYLKWLRDHGTIDRRTYRLLYRKVKGGAFDSLASLKRYMRDHGILPQNIR
ncbi:MAG: 50S ribosomal protein L19e [Ignisphaera sp.]|nr:50S ribosomal protein L19e [Ignisphaera sp.]MCX8168498.1 50S ribosomal protein L19e [Ignisphaera sp.]MDW8085062.1 50S ribosomal protein L19e [Ignisphaera sp.]